MSTDRPQSQEIAEALRASADNLWLLVNVLAMKCIAEYGTQADRRKAVRWLKTLFGGEAFGERP
jgi:hypothetical protein